MLKLQLNAGCWEISFGNSISLTHSRSQPFVSIVCRQNVQEGQTTSTHPIETQRIPLCNMKAEGLDTLIFSNGEHRLNVRFRENSCGVDLVFQGEEDQYYEFCFPAIEGETILGGGTYGDPALNNTKIETAGRKMAPVFMTDTCRLFLFGAEALTYSRFDEEKYCFAFATCPKGAAILKGNSYDQLCNIINDRMPLQKFYFSTENERYSLKECFSLAFSGIPALIISEPELYSSFFRFQKHAELIHRLEIECFSLNKEIHISADVHNNRKLNRIINKLTEIHNKLSPYLIACREEAVLGLPQIRPDFWDSVKYSSSKDRHSYYLGSDMFICPVVEKSSQKRTVHLPYGKWVHLWSGKEYEGNVQYCFPAVPGKCPAFWKKGSRYEELFLTFSDESGAQS